MIKRTDQTGGDGTPIMIIIVLVSVTATGSDEMRSVTCGGFLTLCARLHAVSWILVGERPWIWPRFLVRSHVPNARLGSRPAAFTPRPGSPFSPYADDRTALRLSIATVGA